jgi:hypothetical protein
VEAELAALATSGATTMVGLMATDAWSQVRGRLARLLARGGETGAVDAELEAARQELDAARAAGDDLAASDVETEWRTRLRRMLRADPAAAQELRLLLAEIDPGAGRGPTVVVHNSVSGTVTGPAIQGQNFGPLTFHGLGAAAPPAVPDPGPGAPPELPPGEVGPGR